MAVIRYDCREKNGGVFMDKIKSEYAVEVVELVKVFNKKKAVDGISFTIRTGTICGLLGPNGAGKTTTINMLATLIKPDGEQQKFLDMT
ncbi:ATP-binding cassette domain-containing protein [Thermoanaerobacterium sp. CMT5567-10]|nr:ATP-binding cassette domain-containing protein [Thermoanaerobacterium sp. CMT5567-10]WLY85463.1 ATP-binding cassette domain-containing protein [Thermoanaerobacterium sp. CMT5567-10]